MAETLGGYELNKVYCEDCLVALKKLPDRCVDLVLTDPPYGIGKATWDSHYPIGFESECLRVANTVAIMCGQWAIPECVFALGNKYLSILALHNRNGMTFSPIGFGNWIPVIIAGDRPKSGQDHISFRVNGDKPNHPSPKPIQAMIGLVSRLSDESDIILDPFAGSGTTLVAAKELGRKFLGFEISPTYVRICEQRLAQEILL